MPRDHREVRNRRLAMVDVEGFVAGGAPRAAFTPEPTLEGSLPFWSIDAEMLRRAGWIVTDTSWQPPPRIGFEPSPHPYALGPMWTGGNTWHAEFVVAGRIVRCTVDHELIAVHRGDGCNPGPPIASGSPWRWHITEQQTYRCGRSESPLEAAAAVEASMRAAGADDFEPTMTRFIHLD